jgi:hypothetical protein
MVSFVRHLVSQHFGRVTATIDVDIVDSAVVRLSTQRPAGSMHFTFSLRSMLVLASKEKSWVEFIIRLAVTQAHKGRRKQKNAPEPGSVFLRSDMQPWMGDLLLTPYGGPTLGVAECALDIQLHRHKRRAAVRRPL